MRRCIALLALLASCHGDGGGGSGGPPPAGVLSLVAFRTPSALFTIELNGANLRLVHDGPVLDYAWSPHKTRLAWRTTGALSVDGAAVSRGPVGLYRWSDDDRLAWIEDFVLFVEGVEVARDVVDFAWGGARLAWRSSANDLFVDGLRVATGALEFAWSPLLDFLAFRNSELFAVRLDRNEVIRLSLDPGAVTFFAWAPDGSHVAWLDGAELFASPPHQQFVVSLATNVTAFAWSPDAQRIAFVADGLYSVFRGGGIPILHSPHLAIGGFAWSPDSTRLLFLADQTRDGSFELFVVPGTSGMYQRISGEDVTAFAWSLDGMALAYVQAGDLFLSGTFLAPDVAQFAFTDDRRLVYVSQGALFVDGLRLADGVLDFSIR